MRKYGLLREIISYFYFISSQNFSQWFCQDRIFFLVVILLIYFFLFVTGLILSLSEDYQIKHLKTRSWGQVLCLEEGELKGKWKELAVRNYLIDSASIIVIERFFFVWFSRARLFLKTFFQTYQERYEPLACEPRCGFLDMRSVQEPYESLASEPKSGFLDKRSVLCMGQDF